MARLLTGIPVNSSNKILGPSIEDEYFAAFEDVAGFATADLEVSVNPSTGDDNDPDRPFPLTSGDQTSYPFETLSGMIAALPKSGRDYTIKVHCAYDTNYDGIRISGFSGTSFSIQLIGTWGAATLGSGPQAFTANVGTTATQLKRRGGVAWTTNDLAGYYCLITGGSGYVNDPLFEAVCPIISNDGDTAVLGGAGNYDMDDTSVVAIVRAAKISTKSSPDAIGTTYGLGVLNNSADVFVRRFEIDVAGDGATYGLCETGNSGQMSVGNVKLKGGSHTKAAGSYSYSPGLILEDAALVVDAVASMSHYTNYIDADSTLTVTNFTHATLDYMDARGCSGQALTVKRGVYAEIGLSANDCTATPLTMYNIHNMKIGAYDLTGTNSGTSYGIVIGESGQYALNGATLAGSDSNEISFEGKEISYSDLSTYGSVRRFGTILQWGSGRELLMQKLTVWLDPDNPGDELATNDHQVGGRLKHYGKHTLLGDAGGTITATGSNLAGAAALKYVANVVNAGTGGVKMQTSGVGAGVGTVITWVMNRTSASINLYPSSGSGTMNGGSAGAAVVIPTHSIATIMSVENEDFMVVISAIQEQFDALYDVDPAVTATGVDQAGAYAIVARTTYVTGGNGGGVRLPTGRPEGEVWTVFNRSATNPGVGITNAIRVYPGSGDTMNPVGLNTRDLLNGNYVGYYTSLGGGTWHASSVPMKSDHVSRTNGDTQYNYGSVFFYNGADLTGTLVQNSGNRSNTVASTLTTAGTTITVNFNTSINHAIDLQGASGDVTVTLSAGASGGWYTVKVIQGSTARQITWTGTGNVKWVGAVTPTITVTNDAIDLFRFYHDGSGYLGQTVAQNLS